jgi:bifunctional enzyme CysN/CysC
MDSESGQPPVTVPRSGVRLATLRFLTCGSVDDGKSTLIGRLLYERNLVYDDHLAALARDSRRHGTTGDSLDLALLMDGLDAEREQGITIDVAYRYFATQARAFIVADCPGHEQYTRNMATGASTADLAVLLVDARKGLLPQTRRHAAIASLLGIRHVVLAVNKMDLVDYDRRVFQAIVDAFGKEAAALRFESIEPIPLSARCGDNVCTGSASTPWHAGPSLLGYLETIDVGDDRSDAALRFPVQWVNRPHLDFRGLAGTVASGRLAVGDDVVIAPSGRRTRVSRIVAMDGDLAAAERGQAATVVLEDDVDAARGDVLSHMKRRPHVADQFAAHLVWMGDDKMLPGRSYWLKIGGRTAPAMVTEIKHRLDVDTNAPLAAKSLSLNEIGFCNLSTSTPVAFDAYADNRETGNFILIDRASNATVAAGMIAFPLRRAGNIFRQALTVDRETRARLKGQKPVILWLTGMSGSGKSTVANAVEARLLARNAHTTLLDGDNLRHGLNRDLGFTDTDRVENIRRVGEVAKLMMDAGLIVLCSFISPFAADRRSVRDLVDAGEFVEIFVDTPLELCIARDPKGLYRRALAGEIRNFTGIDQPYEVPTDPELRFETGGTTADDIAARIVDYLEARHIIEPL